MGREELTIAEIHDRYRGQWVLIQGTREVRGQITAGYVLVHNQSDLEAAEKAAELLKDINPSWTLFVKAGSYQTPPI